MMESACPFITLEGIEKRFGGVQALRKVSLRIQPGEVHSMAGENGSGKSTLIKILSGVCQPDAGAIVIDNERLNSLRPMDAIRRGIQVIYQDFSLFPNLSVGENLAINHLLEHSRWLVRWRSVRKTARDALSALGVDMDLDQPLGELSVAEKQLVAIARALLHEARLIIMDEPTAALSGIEVEALLKIVRRLKQEGVAILFVSHKLREVLAISDRLTVLRNGEVVAEGPAAEFDEAGISYRMTGRRLRESRCMLPHDRRRQSLLKAERLSGRVVRDVSFELCEGEIVGLTGLLGSGQTELALMLFGIQPCSGGTLLIRGEKKRIGNVRDAIAAGIAYLPEDRLAEGLFLEQSVERNVVAADLASLRNRAGLIPPSRVRQETARWLTELAIKAPSGQIPVSALSGGNQQRVVLAKWLSTRPGILILNGPTVGVDVGSRQAIHDQLRELAARGMGILLISDDPPELAANCNRILVMHQGRVVDEFSGGECDGDTIARRLSSFQSR
jgi:simple sugar transport system ATP-binding protein